MKKLIFCLTIAALASVASLQAGEGKECAASCADKATKVAKASECTKSASECSKASGCSKAVAKKACPLSKGATLLLAKL